VQSRHYLRVVRSSAWYDVLVTWPFALPWTFGWVYGELGRLSGALGLPGTMPALDPMHMLFANLLGSVVVVWGLARMLAPSVQLGRLDALSRVLFASWQVYAVLSGGGAIVLAFTVVEIAFGVLQLMPVGPDAPDHARGLGGRLARVA